MNKAHYTYKTYLRAPTLGRLETGACALEMSALLAIMRRRRQPLQPMCVCSVHSKRVHLCARSLLPLNAMRAHTRQHTDDSNDGGNAVGICCYVRFALCVSHPNAEWIVGLRAAGRLNRVDEWWWDDNETTTTTQHTPRSISGYVVDMHV